MKHNFFVTVCMIPNMGVGVRHFIYPATVEKERAPRYKLLFSLYSLGPSAAFHLLIMNCTVHFIFMFA
jgi:hypothetical protein